MALTGFAIMISHLSSEKLALKRTMTSKTTTITSGNTDTGKSTAVGIIPIPQPTTRGQSKRLAPLLRSSGLFQSYVQSTLGSRYLMIERAWTFVRGPPPGTFSCKLGTFYRRFAAILQPELTFNRDASKSTTDKSCRPSRGGGSPIRGGDPARCSSKRLA